MIINEIDLTEDEIIPDVGTANEFQNFGVYSPTPDNYDDFDSHETEDDTADAKADAADDTDEDMTDDLADDEALSGEVESPDALYSIEYVAKELETDTTTLRNFLRDFDDYVNVKRTQGGHRRFTRDNIDKLRSILELKRDNGYTNAQLKSILGRDVGEIMSGSDSLERLDKLLKWNVEKMREIVDTATEQIKQNQEMLLEDKEAQERQNKLIETVNRNAEDISKVTESFSAVNEQISQLTELVKKLAQDNSEKDEQIRQLSEQNKQILENTTKKKLFGIF